MVFEEFDKLFEEREILPLGDVKVYLGIFTGKLVKKDEEKECGCFDKFKKGDKVIVYKLEDYKKYRKGKKVLMDNFKKSTETTKKK